ncbi:DUF4190 domain-containing protein [Streptomyces sp. DSM 42041]|uniref:DUF4190 domain-containing protein n=1 Tax=Streptomyces hazeniae TaxID=3075538 RepID=A0ABU2NQK2_9ACTN|nr:DUF4190 domain-containing protein [Streptomyces sp. DSM 42041]MDT0379258.1 DUF4190 domain-containing protein [Streptomyces sp. DSM 42041]
MDDTARRDTGLRRPDGMANAAFVLGLVGLVVLPICLGPVAIVLGVLALRRDTTLRGRARLGLALGTADVLVFAVSLAAERDWLGPLF